MLSINTIINFTFLIIFFFIFIFGSIDIISIFVTAISHIMIIVNINNVDINNIIIIMIKAKFK